MNRGSKIVVTTMAVRLFTPARRIRYSREVPRYGLRQKVGAVVYDWPRILRAMSTSRGWVRYRNRNESLTLDPHTGGARCDWMYTSDLHLCAVYPFTARWLLRRATAQWPIESAERPKIDGGGRVSGGAAGAGRWGGGGAVAGVGSSGSTHATRGEATGGFPIECIVVEQS